MQRYIRDDIEIFGAGGTATEEETDTGVTTGLPAKVILFNDNTHTFEEVITQLCKATGCSPAEAEGKANEVHTRGKAIVYEGEVTDCLRVSGVLEEIALHTQVEM